MKVKPYRAEKEEDERAESVGDALLLQSATSTNFVVKLCFVFHTFFSSLACGSRCVEIPPFSKQLDFLRQVPGAVQVDCDMPSVQ